MIIENNIKIYKILIFISCFVYAYRLDSIFGLVYFSMATLVWGITGYNEGGEINKTNVNIIVFAYIIGLISGSLFLFDIPSVVDAHSSPRTIVALVSLVMLIFIFINLLNLYINGKPGFIELNNKVLRSRNAIEQEEQKHDLDEFVDKYKPSKKESSE